MPKIPFRTGRKDCVPASDDDEPYIATKGEVHPTPHANGPDTLKGGNSVTLHWCKKVFCHFLEQFVQKYLFNFMIRPFLPACGKVAIVNGSSRQSLRDGKEWRILILANFCDDRSFKVGEACQIQ